MEILKTKNYDQFKVTDINRADGVKHEHVRKLSASIAARNYLHMKPITVNTDMEVLDGQHRLQAAKYLGVDIYYVIDREIQREDIVTLNINNKLWSLNDYLNAWVKLGNQQYINFDNFMKDKNLSIHEALALCRIIGRYQKDDFKSGRLVFDKKNVYEKHSKIINIIQAFTEVLSNKTFLNKGKFIRALTAFVYAPNYNEEIFLDKIIKCGYKLQPRLSHADYIPLLSEIYNYKNRDPIEVTDA